MKILCKPFLIFLLGLVHLLPAQNQGFQIHSHNDYHQKVPFWEAYAHGLSSLEADVFLKNDTLYVTHDERDIILDRTLQTLYLEPLQRAIILNIPLPGTLQLLVDIKSEPHATLDKLISVLDEYPKLVNSKNISIVISGNRPAVKSYLNYPDHIRFDYQSLDKIEQKEILEKIALISLNFKAYSAWNGKGRLTAADFKVVNSVVEKAHTMGKPFRFWGSPDSKTAWKAFVDIGVDYINTDMPSRASTYLKTLGNRVTENTSFSKPYVPTYVPDQSNKQVKNVILLIGDGNGLTQISAATLANGGRLTLTQLRSIGLMKTQSADDFTTDSAAAGTAISTGTKTNNRAIGMNPAHKPLQNLTEFLSLHGFLSGCITTDEMTGATPASFYAHQVDRSMVKEIAADLTKSKLSFFVGGGSDQFKNSGLNKTFTLLPNLASIGKSKAEKIGVFVSEHSVPSILDGRGAVLATATRKGLQFFKQKGRPFFLMIEAAQIDSFGHTNDVSGIVKEGIDFDKAITEAIKFADLHKNTLVIVTADHETSGFSIPQGNLDRHMVEGDFTTYDHTGTMVPVFAYGPGSQEFQGVYENSALFEKIIKTLQLDNK